MSLHPDLAPYVDGDGVWHPLLYMAVDLPESVESANAVYASKREALAKAADEGDWDSYVFLHERPHRLGALQEAELEGLEGPAYCRLIRDVWIDSENIWQFEDEWRDLLPLGARWQHYLMDDDEQTAFAALPDPVPVLRGFSHDEGQYGLSWTIDRERAEWFAHRFALLNGSAARVAAGTVFKADVIAYLLGRNEREIVVLPENVSIVEVVDLAPAGR
jgi:hypothetical protein